MEVGEKDIPTVKDPKVLWKRVEDMLNSIPNFPSIDCDKIIESNDEEEIANGKRWILPKSIRNIWKRIENSTDQCKTLKESFVFSEEPFSKEEANFPLAFGAIVHKDVTQITYMLSALYQPQNVFILIVDGDAPVDFKNKVDIFGDCFNNIHVIVSFIFTVIQLSVGYSTRRRSTGVDTVL